MQAKQIHTQEDANRFIERFYGFSDSLVRTVTFRYIPGGSQDVELQIDARDSKTEENESWVRVEILIQDVIEMKFREEMQTTHQVLMFGIHIQLFEDHFAVEFGDAMEPVESMFDYKASDGYAIGSRVSYKVSEYQREC